VNILFLEKRFLAIIPARSGSKGLKDKNIKDLNGRAIMSYTIEAAKKSDVFDDVIVSTEAKAYADIAINYGAAVPFLRPDYLSTDEATTNDVVEYTIRELEKVGKKYDYFMILQPTSPLRRAEDILGAVELLFKKNANSVVSVCESEHSPLYMNTLDKTLSLKEFLPKDVKTRRQELPKYYRLNGAIYLCKVDYFLKYKDFYKEDSYAYIMEKTRSIDIDDEHDFRVAECMLNNEL